MIREGMPCREHRERTAGREGADDRSWETRGRREPGDGGRKRAWRDGAVMAGLGETRVRAGENTDATERD